MVPKSKPQKANDNSLQRIAKTPLNYVISTGCVKMTELVFYVNSHKDETKKLDISHGAMDDAAGLVRSRI